MLRVQGDHGVRRMGVGWRELEGEALEDGAQRHLRFQQREVLADADPGTPSERKEGALVLASVGDAVSEPCRIELARIFSPNLRIMVNEENGQHKVHSGGICDAAELHLLVCSSDYKGYRRVQPKDLVQNHGYLHRHGTRSGLVLQLSDMDRKLINFSS